MDPACRGTTCLSPPCSGQALELTSRGYEETGAHVRHFKDARSHVKAETQHKLCRVAFSGRKLRLVLEMKWTERQAAVMVPS
jgi:hypothetical protein